MRYLAFPHPMQMFGESRCSEYKEMLADIERRTQEAVSQMRSLGLSIRVTAELFGISKSTLHRALQREAKVRRSEKTESRSQPVYEEQSFIFFDWDL